MNIDHDLGEDLRDALLGLLIWRRDVRHFRPDPLEPGQLERLLQTVALAPSVGLSQPWRFVQVQSVEARAAVRSNFLAANEAALTGYEGDRARLYAGLKLAGLDQAPVHLAVFAEPDPEAGHGLGRQTMPETIAYSVVIAIHTLWLAARVEGIGLGWVSILEPEALHRDLAAPTDWKFIAYLCLGRPQDAFDTPELERVGWERRVATTPLIVR